MNDLNAAASAAVGTCARVTRTNTASALLFALASLAGCEGNRGPAGAMGDDGADGAAGADGPAGSDGQAYAPATVFVATNAASGNYDVSVRTESLALLTRYTTGANEGLLVDAAGHLAQAGDIGGSGNGRIVTACNAATRATGETTREVTGANTGLATPKGLTRIDEHGLLVAANVGASNLLVFGAASSGDVAPLATVALSANAWDSVYDAKADRLFAALTNGSVAVFDNFVTNLGTNAAARTIVIQDGNGAAAINLHGIDYDAAGDRLIVSDVGAADNAADGKLYVVTNASTANGVTMAATTFAGANTRLGNPVDLALTGTDVRIAEKANGGGALLVYRNIFEAAGGNVAPDTVIATPNPESVAVVADAMPAAGATDIIDPVTPYRLLTTSNSAGDVFVTPRTLGADPVKLFDVNDISVENMTIDRNGDAYVVYDDNAGNGGIAVIGAIDARSGGTLGELRDRRITGPATMLQAPKGVELADDLGLLIVAETTGAKLLVFSACASGNADPIAVTSTGGVAPWDSDYDPTTDTLFAALTNGQVAVYDHYSLNLGVDGPSRVLIPVMGGTPFAAPTNLHGIRYDQRSDTLILSDVGSGAVGTDGALMTLPFASSAVGNVEVGKRVAGPTTLLGNPVDIAFDGTDLYVAEKSNAQLQVWRNFLTDSALTGDVAASASRPATQIESVVLGPLH